MSSVKSKMGLSWVETCTVCVRAVLRIRTVSAQEGICSGRLRSPTMCCLHSGGLRQPVVLTQFKFSGWKSTEPIVLDLESEVPLGRSTNALRQQEVGVPALEENRFTTLPPPMCSAWVGPQQTAEFLSILIKRNPYLVFYLKISLFQKHLHRHQEIMSC